MNDKDKEAFEEWDSLPVDQVLTQDECRKWLSYDCDDFIFCKKAWQAACEYKDKQYLSGGKMKEINERIEGLLAENAKMRECVEFYADPENYYLTTHQRPRVKSSQRVLTDKDLSDVESHILQVGGKRARQVLKELDDKIKMIISATQYNEIYSEDTGILISKYISEDINYLTVEVKKLQAENAKLKEKLLNVWKEAEEFYLDD